MEARSPSLPRSGRPRRRSGDAPISPHPAGAHNDTFPLNRNGPLRQHGNVAPAQRTSGRSVTSKVVALLDAFTPAEPVLSLNELAAATGLTTSTAHRLANELVEWGGLERGENGGYRIGLRMWEI